MLAHIPLTEKTSRLSPAVNLVAMVVLLTDQAAEACLDAVGAGLTVAEVVASVVALVLKAGAVEVPPEDLEAPDRSAALSKLRLLYWRLGNIYNYTLDILTAVQSQLVNSHFLILYKVLTYFWACM